MTAPSLEFDVSLERADFRLQVAGRVEPGITALFGPSGSGKTTLLRCLAGLEPDCRGEIWLGEQSWQRGGWRLPTHARGAGLVFQDARLFAHCSVAGNLRYALRRRRGPGPEYDDVIAALGLRPLLERRTAGLSGGERQRVALARALLAAPSVLLLDEPLAALDAARRAAILALIRGLPARYGLPLVYVTHDQEEVLHLADRVLLLREGQRVGSGPGPELFSDPAVWPSLGDAEPGVIWRARVVSQDNAWSLSTLASDGGRLRVPAPGLEIGSSVTVRVRARDVLLALDPPRGTSALNALPVRVTDLRPEGEASVLVGLQTAAGGVLWARVTRQSSAALGLQDGRRLHALFKGSTLAVGALPPAS